MKLWINCIYVHCNEEGKWAATLKWNSTQVNELRRIQGYMRGDFSGEVHTQYFEDTLTLSIDKVLDIAKYMNITENENMKPVICYTEDQELLEQFPASASMLDAIEVENMTRIWNR